MDVRDNRKRDPDGDPAAYSENAPGPIYVETGLCLLCGVPETEAPDLIGFHDDPRGPAHSHCYFRKQPETREELDRAIEAVRLACCGALCYSGRDPAIISRLLAAGVHRTQIDALRDEL